MVLCGALGPGMSIEQRLLDLADSARRRAADARRHAFARLQTDDPAQAAFLQAVASEFGKPSVIAITFADGTGYRSGRFVAAQDCPDFEQRWRPVVASKIRRTVR